MDDLPLIDRVVAITGAGSGLGRAYAVAAATAGAAVVVSDIKAAAAHSVAQSITLNGGRAVPIVGSVSETQFAERMCAAAEDSFGGLDGLINNAAIFQRKETQQVDISEAREILTVNVEGVINCALAAIPYFRRGHGGVILNIVSGAALGMPGMSLYGASKGAVMSLTSAWALDLISDNIRVVGLSPVATTPMLSAAGNVRHDAMEPEELAHLAVYLLSDAASHLNGRILRAANREIQFLEPVRYGASLQPKHWSQRSITDLLKTADDSGKNTEAITLATNAPQD